MGDGRFLFIVTPMKHFIMVQDIYSLLFSVNTYDSDPCGSQTPTVTLPLPLSLSLLSLCPSTFYVFENNMQTLKLGRQVCQRL